MARQKDIDAAKTLQYGMQYLDIMMIGLIPFAITQIYAGSLREMGESKPMIGGIASVAVDIVFNYLLIWAASVDFQDLKCAEQQSQRLWHVLLRCLSW